MIDPLASLSLNAWSQIAQVALALVAVVGIPPAIYVYVHERRKDRHEQTFRDYNAMGDQWADFLWRCLEHPSLGLVVLGISNAEYDPEDLYLYSLLIQLLNRAYVTYKDQPESVRADRYRGWDAYMDALAQQDGFRRAWRLLGNGYDTRFAEEFDSRLPADWRTLSRRPFDAS
jgi:hypothetical protein